MEMIDVEHFYYKLKILVLQAEDHQSIQGSSKIGGSKKLRKVFK